LPVVDKLYGGPVDREGRRLYPGSQTVDHVQSFARLFMLPGMYHCQGGTSPSRVDWLTSSVTWVEQGKLPTNVIASETAADSASGGFSNPTEGAMETMQKLSKQDRYHLQLHTTGKR